MRKIQQRLLGVASVVALASIGVWLLFDYWQGRAPVEEPQAEELALRSDLNVQQMQEMLNDEIAGTLTSEQQDRIDSPLGLALFRKCAEWTEFNDNHPSDNARENEERACSEYRHYVETGDTPEE